MTLRYTEEIKANLERAEQSIQAARELITSSYYDFAVSRAYYAAFYAATALLLAEELTFSKHSGVIAHIHQKFVKIGKLDTQRGKDLNWLFELRSTADYDVTVRISPQDASRAIKAAEDFLKASKSLIPSALGS